MRLLRNTIVFALSFLILFPASGITATLQVSWNANTETDLGGYLIYYGTQSGNYSACIDVGNVTGYQLTGVQSGITCYVAVAAYDTSQNDSALSVEQRVTVPLPTSYTTVPNVVGMTQNNAKSTLTAAGLVTVFAGSSYSTTVPAGSIKSQYPAGGASVAPGTSVNLIISAGPEMKTVPNVVGITQSTAQSLITSAGLSVGTIRQANSTTVSAGKVISQSPASGTLVAIGTAVNFTVSSGSAVMKIVPNLRGTAASGAGLTLINVGLLVGATYYENSSTISKGYIIRTNPAAGASVPVGSSVDLVVSKGPQQVAVPNVVGMTQSAAQSSITTAGLMGSVNLQYNSAPVGQVIGQTPAANTMVNIGSWVTLTVSKGPMPPVMVPNLRGTAASGAGLTLINVGLLVGATYYENSSTISKGYIIRTNPAAGTSVPRGSSVDLVVSNGP